MYRRSCIAAQNVGRMGGRVGMHEGHGISRVMTPRGHRLGINPQALIERPPRNTILNIVPQGHECVVERFGSFNRVLTAGIWPVIPLVERIRYTYNVKEQGIDIPNQFAITSDNVMVEIDGVMFLRVIDSKKASYNIENPIYNLINLAQTTMRSEIGRINLDLLFRERASLNKNIIEVLRREASEWGIECKRYEIRDIVVSELVRQAMDLEAEAERRKRKLILESEGEAQAEVNRAQGLKMAQEYAADAQKYTILRNAEGGAEATRIEARATSDSVAVVSECIAGSPRSTEALSVRIAERYINAFAQLAKETNSVVMSQPIGDPSSFASQALGIYKSIADSQTKK